MKRLFFIFISLIFLFGCATTRHKSNMNLEERVRELEEEIKIRDEQISALEKELSARKDYQKIEHPITTKNIQMALQKANFYNGSIDGVMGPKTQEAIKKFQKANGLKPDGVVGKRTWRILSRYLD